MFIYLEFIFNLSVWVYNSQGGGVFWKCRKVNFLRRMSRMFENMFFFLGLFVDIVYWFERVSC